MTNVGQAATAELVTAAGAPTAGWTGRLLGLVAVALALLSALATFLVLADLTPIVQTHIVVLTMLIGDGVAALFLLMVIGWEIWRVFQARRRGRAAARLHIRIVALFSLIAAVPAILVAIVASITLDRGLDRLFSRQMRAMIQNSLTVAEAYVREHGQFVRGDAIATAIELVRAKPLFEANREQFHQFLNAQAAIRTLPAIIMLDKDLNIIDKAETPIPTNFFKPSAEVIAAINDNEPQIAFFLDANIVAGLIKLRLYHDTYLYVARVLDPKVVAQLQATREGISQYAELEARRVGIQIAFALVYTMIALIVLLSA